MKSRVGALAGTLTLLFACSDTAPARDQWLVAFGTDAPVPNLADRLRVELIGTDGSACGGCIREFAANDPALFPISLGVEPAPDLRVRARLYRADHLLSVGTPDPVTTIDVLGSLGAAPNGITPLSLTLPMACIGKPADVTANTSCDPSSGSVGSIVDLTQHSLPAPGSWPPSTKVPCPGPPPAGMVCLDGGVFFMGDDRSPRLTHDFNLDPFPEHVVQLSPFAIDRDELTVGEFKTIFNANPHVSFTFAEKSSNIVAPEYACTYQSNSRENDALPMNCVVRDSAEQLCALQGKQLMTEAQFEYAARNRGADTTFPWGAADAPCAYSVVGVGRVALEIAFLDQGDNFDCRTRPDGSLGPWGPRAGGSPSDVTRDGVLNLAGNLSEWVRDDPVPYTDPFWSASGLLDPVATGGSGVSGRGAVIRGASYAVEPGLARAVLRQTLPNGNAFDNVGVRCVKQML